MNNKIKALLLAVVCCVAAGCGTASGNSQKQTTDATSFESEYASISLLCDVDFWEPPVWDETPKTITGDISKKTGAVLNVIETTQDADTQLKILLLNDKLPDLI